MLCDVIYYQLRQMVSRDIHYLFLKEKKKKKNKTKQNKKGIQKIHAAGRPDPWCYPTLSAYLEPVISSVM